MFLQGLGKVRKRKSGQALGHFVERSGIKMCHVVRYSQMKEQREHTLQCSQTDTLTSTMSIN